MKNTHDKINGNGSVNSNTNSFGVSLLQRYVHRPGVIAVTASTHVNKQFQHMLKPIPLLQHVQRYFPSGSSMAGQAELVVAYPKRENGERYSSSNFGITSPMNRQTAFVQGQCAVSNKKDSEDEETMFQSKQNAATSLGSRVFECSVQRQSEDSEVESGEKEEEEQPIQTKTDQCGHRNAPLAFASSTFPSRIQRQEEEESEEEEPLQSKTMAGLDAISPLPLATSITTQRIQRQEEEESEEEEPLQSKAMAGLDAISPLPLATDIAAQRIQRQEEEESEEEEPEEEVAPIQSKAMAGLDAISPLPLATAIAAQRIQRQEEEEDEEEEEKPVRPKSVTGVKPSTQLPLALTINSNQIYRQEEEKLEEESESKDKDELVQTKPLASFNSNIPLPYPRGIILTQPLSVASQNGRVWCQTNRSRRQIEENEEEESSFHTNAMAFTYHGTDKSLQTNTAKTALMRSNLDLPLAARSEELANSNDRQISDQTTTSDVAFQPSMREAAVQQAQRMTVQNSATQEHGAAVANHSEDQITERVLRKVLRSLAVERERRGWFPWN